MLLLLTLLQKHLAKRGLLGMLANKAKLWGSEIWNRVLKERPRLLLNLMDMVAWLS